jgi:hypothetical protein
MYCSGLVSNGPAHDPPNAIVLWRSDDGGVSWLSASVIVSNGSNRYVLDKPFCAVSWDPGSLGYVYVTWNRVDNLDANQNTLFVAVSLDGGNSFLGSYTATTGWVQGPDIVVNSTTGDVYLLWTDFTTNSIRMATSLDHGVHWSPPETVASGTFLNPNDPLIGGGVRMFTLPNELGRGRNGLGVAGKEFHAAGRIINAGPTLSLLLKDCFRWKQPITQPVNPL